MMTNKDVAAPTDEKTPLDATQLLEKLEQTANVNQSRAVELRMQAAEKDGVVAGIRWSMDFVQKYLDGETIPDIGEIHAPRHQFARAAFGGDSVTS